MKGKEYYFKIEICGGKPPYSWEKIGNFPPGLYLSQGAISGIPTRLGSFHFKIRVKDNSTPQSTIERDFTIRVVGVDEDFESGSFGESWKSSGNAVWSVSYYQNNYFAFLKE